MDTSIKEITSLNDLAGDLEHRIKNLEEKVVPSTKNLSENENLSEDEKSETTDIALKLLNHLNDELKKLGNFKVVIIGGFAILKSKDYVEKLYKLSITDIPVYSTTDIDVKICSTGDPPTSHEITKIFDNLEEPYKYEQYGIHSETGQISAFKTIDETKELELLPVLRAKIISILDKEIKKYKPHEHLSHPFPDLKPLTGTKIWGVRNTLRRKEKELDFLPEKYPIKVFYGNTQLIDISFSLTEPEILCDDSFEYEFNIDNEQFKIPMAKLSALAKNLLTYTSPKGLQLDSLRENKISSWLKQLKIVKKLADTLVENKTNASGDRKSVV